MPAPSQLASATSSLHRLAKEEASYHKELQMQQKSIDRLEKSQVEETDEDRGNYAFQLKQEVRGPSGGTGIPAHLIWTSGVKSHGMSRR